MPLQRQIELKQENATIINSNGDFELNLLEPLYINQSDTIEIKNVFIDTRKTSAEGTINIPEDIKAEFDIYKYVIDHTAENNVNGDAKRGRDYFGSVRADHPKANKYLLCKSVSSQQYERVDSLNFLVSRIFPLENLRSKTYTFGYANIGGDDATFTISISKDTAKDNLDKAGEDSFIYTFSTFKPIVMIGGTLNFIPDSQSTGIWGKEGMVRRQGMFWDPKSLNNNRYVDVPQGASTSSYNETTITVASGFEPYSEKLKFTLNAGQYTPDNLATLITKNLTVIPGNKVDIKDSKTLTVCGSYDGVSGYGFVNELGTDYFEVGPENQFWLGSNQISCVYNQLQSKFEFDYLHMPYYSEILPSGSAETNGAIVNKVIEVPINDPTDPTKNTTSNVIVGSAAGVLISNWSTNLFQDIMGFTSDNLVTVTDYNIVTISGSNVHLPVLSLVDGINSTSGFAGLDTLIKKTSPTWYLEPSLKDLESTTDITSSILAFNVIQPQQEEQFAYYNVQLEAGFSTDYIMSNNVKRNINCIVSKYYSVDSYTIFQGQGIIYEHNGAPQMLSRMKVRILDPDFNNPNIGTDNTMLLLLNQNK